MNFVSRSMLAGIKHQLIVSRAAEFFSRDDILIAKELFKFFVKSAKENRALPTFVIFEPIEVPSCMEEINACITTKLL